MPHSFSLYITLNQGEVKGVGVMKDEELKPRAKVWLRKRPMDLCACESEEHEHGVGAGVNAILMSDVLY